MKENIGLALDCKADADDKTRQDKSIQTSSALTVYVEYILNNGTY